MEYKSIPKTRKGYGTRQIFEQVKDQMEQLQGSFFDKVKAEKKNSQDKEKITKQNVIYGKCNRRYEEKFNCSA